jgi:hypothetical protein
MLGRESDVLYLYAMLTAEQKWTRSQSLSTRFNGEVLGNPKSFTKRNFGPLLSQYNDLITTIRVLTPDSSEPMTPRQPRRPSAQISVQEVQRTYWNEYDEDSEAGNEPYTIYLDPEAESTFPGARTVAYVFSLAKDLIKKIKAWLSPIASSSERQPYVVNNGYFPEQTETDLDDEAHASSSNFPRCYATLYATFPNISDQNLSQHGENFLFWGTIGSLGAALVLLLLAGILIITGRHGLRIEVDAGVIVGITSSLFFGGLGLGMMLTHREQVGWVHKICVSVTFVVICVLDSMLLVLVAGKTDL